MKTRNISDVRNELPSIVEEVARTSEEVVVTRYGAPMVTITPCRDHGTQTKRYPLRGHPLELADDFDVPMPELWRALAVAEEIGRAHV